MSSEKQRLYNEIKTLPDEFAGQVINFIGYLKMSCIDAKAPDDITIKSKKDLKEKLQKENRDESGQRRMKPLPVFSFTAHL